MNGVQISSLDLLQILRLQKERKQVNCYVFAISKSKLENPTYQILQILTQFVVNEQKGDRWLEAIRRLCLNNFNIVFQFAINNFYVLRAVIQEVPNLANSNHLVAIRQNLYQANQSIIHQLNERQLKVIIQTYEMYIRIWLLNQFQPNQSYKTLELIDKSLILLNFVKTNIFQMENIYLHNNNNITLLKLLTSIFLLYSKLENYQTKKLNYFKFKKVFINIEALRENTIDKIIRLAINNQFKSQFLQLLLSFLDCHSSIKYIFPHNKILASQLIKKLNFNQLEQFNTDTKQFMNAELDMIYDQQSQDNKTLVCKLARYLCSKVDGFIMEYVSEIKKKIQVEQLKNSKTIMYFYIIYQNIQFRVQLQPFIKQIIEIFIQKIINPISNPLTNALNLEDQILICRIIRSMTIFRSLMGQKCIQKCFTICLEILLCKKKESILNLQANQILQKIIDDDVISRVIKDNMFQFSQKLFEILSQSNYQLNLSIEFFDVLKQYFSKFQDIIIRKVSIWIELLSNMLNNQINFCWSKKQKISPYLLKILQLIQTILEISKQTSCLQDTDQYFKVQSNIFPILNLMSFPQKISFEDQLIQIFHKMLDLAATFTGQLCLIMMNLKNIFIKNQCSLYSFLTIILKISGKKQIRSTIIFDYSQIIPYFINMFIMYLEKVQNSQYIVLYPQQFMESIRAIQFFIQSFSDWTQKKELQLFVFTQTLIKINNILNTRLNQIISDNKINQFSLNLYLKCQQSVIENILTIHHLNSFSRKLLVLSSQYHQIINLVDHYMHYKPLSRYNCKLTVLCLCDLLIKNNQVQERLLQNIMNFYLLAKNFKNISIQQQIVSNKGTISLQFPFNKIILKDYLTLTLKQSKKQKKIDDIQFNFCMKKCY